MFPKPILSKAEINDEDDGHNFTCTDLSAIDDTCEDSDSIAQAPAPKAPVLDFTIQYGGKYVGFATHEGILDYGGAANLMPTSEYYEEYDPLNACETRFFFGDESFKEARGMVRDVVVSVGGFRYLVDFVVMDMAARNNDFRAPIILGHLFLRTSRAILDYDRMTAMLRYRSNSIEIPLSRDQEPEVIDEGFVLGGVEVDFDPTTDLSWGVTTCDAAEGMTVGETENEKGLKKWMLENPNYAADEFPRDDGGWSSTQIISMETPGK